MKDDADRGKRLWAVVLAAGKGTRLGSVTRALCGRELPKQFVALTTQRTLLQETVERIAPLVPHERTVVVVSDRYAEIARAQLAFYPGVEIVVQPSDRGTGPGVMLGLAHVLARAPEADVAVFPSDHHIERPEALLNAVRRGHALSRPGAGGHRSARRAGGAGGQRPRLDRPGRTSLSRRSGRAELRREAAIRAGAAVAAGGRAVEHHGHGGRRPVHSGGCAGATCPARRARSTGTCGPSIGRAPTGCCACCTTACGRLTSAAI